MGLSLRGFARGNGPRKQGERMATVVERIASYAEGLRYEDIDQKTRDCAKRVLLDAIGCALGALEGEPVRIVRQVARNLGGAPQATWIGQNDKTSVVLAALANGVAIRYLDFKISTTCISAPRGLPTRAMQRVRCWPWRSRNGARAR